MISVVLPTIRGREQLLEQTIAAYHDTAPSQLELIVIRDRPTCGEAWNAGAELATGTYLLLGADDLAPHPGWAESAIAVLEAGHYPAPWIVETDGRTLCCGSLGAGVLLGDRARDGLPAVSSPIPFMRRDLARFCSPGWERIGPSLAIHYYADDYLAYRARLAGRHTFVARGYKFTHLDGQLGRRRLVARSAEDRATYAEAVSCL